MTRYCGPVLDTLLELRPGYSSAVDFVHVEIYKNNQTTDVISTVDACKANRGCSVSTRTVSSPHASTEPSIRAR
jgi:hypothetical protein